MKYLYIFFLVGAIAQASHGQACGPEAKQAVMVVDGRSPIEDAAPADKAVLYVISTKAAGLQMKVSADRQWIGAIQDAHRYFVAALEPGKHDLCARMDRHAFLASSTEQADLPVQLEAGKKYYVKEWVTVGLSENRMHLTQISEEEAQPLLKKSKRVELRDKL